jgi:hypothetical protein
VSQPQTTPTSVGFQFTPQSTFYHQPSLPSSSFAVCCLSSPFGLLPFGIHLFLSASILGALLSHPKLPLLLSLNCPLFKGNRWNLFLNFVTSDYTTTTCCQDMQIYESCELESNSKFQKQRFLPPCINVVYRQQPKIYPSTPTKSPII